MKVFWDDILKPIITSIDAKNIVEVGSEAGGTTKFLLDYCQEHNAKLTAIDPFPQFEKEDYAQYGDKFQLYTELSLSRLPLLFDYDVIIIDGDHNWYTVYNELKIIEKNFEGKKLPIILLHDVAWPYARRDLYYNPDNIPKEYRQPYKKMGISPENTSLMESGGINSHHYNAIYENNPQNGVLTAVEDFMKESSLNLSFRLIDIFYGLGILYPSDKKMDSLVDQVLDKADLIKILEKERLALTLSRSELIEVYKDLKERNKSIGETLKDFNKKYRQLEKRNAQKNKTLALEREKIAQTQNKLITTENQLNLIQYQLETTEKSLKEIKQEKERIINRTEKQIKLLNSHIIKLEENTFQSNYYNNQGRSIGQRLISTFPSLYILLNRKNNGFKNALLNIKGYKAIKNNGLLDIGYYLKKYQDVRTSGADPILHYIYHGYKEGRSPNHNFDGNYYYKKHADVRDSNLNPLIHYSLYGIHEKRKTIHTIQKPIQQIEQKQPSAPVYHENNYGNFTEAYLSKKDSIKFPQYSSHQIDQMKNALTTIDTVTIIIPIYNAYEDTKKCIKSVMKHTKIPYQLILIDDCSTDERISTLLEEMEEIPYITVIRNKENQGFVRNVNIGIKNSPGDVVLLNSDTMVTPKWLSKLIVAAYTDEKIGTVTPFSNAAGAFSVPEVGEENEIKEDLGLEGTANLVEKVSNNTNMRVPTGNGFCLFIKRDMIYDVGLFDEENFPQGYGEENDYCMRGLERGWTHIIDDSTYIYHKKSASFSTENEEVNEIRRKNRAMVSQKHPNYTKLSREFVLSDEYADIRIKIREALEAPDNIKFNRKNILYVIHEGHGGTLHTNDDLMKLIQKDMDCYLLSSDTEKVVLWKYYQTPIDDGDESTKVYHKQFRDNVEQICSWDIKSEWSAKDYYNPEFRDIYFNVLTGLKIDIVHARHLFKHTFDLPEIAQELGIPLVLSFHDFYFICPSHLLLDQDNVYCAGQCSPGEGQCFHGSELNDLPDLKLFVKEWRNHVKKILTQASAFVTTSELIKDLYISIFPELADLDFQVIEHGRDFKTIKNPSDYYLPPSKDKTIKILFPGNINIGKGGEFIKEIKKLDTDSRLEFHFMGALQRALNLEEYGTFHGRYRRDEFCKVVKSIRPSFIGLFSINPETYVHTLSEAWSCGVPVIATKIGVLEERVNKSGGGWLIEIDPVRAYQEILRISNSPQEYQDVVKKVEKVTLVTSEEMKDNYWNLYWKYLNENPPI